MTKDTLFNSLAKACSLFKITRQLKVTLVAYYFNTIPHNIVIGLVKEK